MATAELGAAAVKKACEQALGGHQPPFLKDTDTLLFQLLQLASCAVKDGAVHVTIDEKMAVILAPHFL